MTMIGLLAEDGFSGKVDSTFPSDALASFGTAKKPGGLTAGLLHI